MKQDFEYYAKNWLELKKLSIKQSTYQRYSDILRIHIFNEFKDMESITQKFLISYFNKKQYLSGSTLKLIKYILRSIIAYSGQSNVLSFQTLKTKSVHTNTKVLTDVQFTYLSNYALLHNNRISRAVLLALYGGLRIGEVCALKWEDIDLENGILYVRHSVIRLKQGLYLQSPKTNTSFRIVPIPDVLIEYLKNWEQEDDLFVVSNTKSLYDPRCVQRCFKTLCRKNGFEVNFHVLRHTYATTCIMSGMDVKSLSEILGHSNVSITLSLYVHSSMEYKKEQVNQIFGK